MRRAETLTINSAAELLEVHPFELVRLLVAGPGFPADLRLTSDHLEQAVRVGGLEAWWQEPGAVRPTANDLQPLAHALLERGVSEPRWTRADNLYRGLDADAERAVRRAVNEWIRSGIMGSRMSSRGLEVTLRAGRERDLMRLGGGKSGRGPA